MIDDPYKILGISRDATDEQIKQAYRQLAKKYHPDRNPGDAEAAKKMQQINAAYEQIKNPEKAQSGAGYGGYDPFGGYQQRTYQQEGDSYQQAAYNYIRFGRYREALNALQNCTAKAWLKCKTKVSLAFGVIAVLVFIISRQTYVSVFAFGLLAIKTIMLIKRA